MYFPCTFHVLFIYFFCLLFFFTPGTLSRSYKKKIAKGREEGNISLTPLLDLRNDANTTSHDATYVVPPPSIDGLTSWRERLLVQKSDSSGREDRCYDCFPSEFILERFGSCRSPHEYLVENSSNSKHYTRMQQIMDQLRSKQTLHHTERETNTNHYTALTKTEEENNNKNNNNNNAVVVSRRSPLTSMDAMDPTMAVQSLLTSSSTNTNHSQNQPQNHSQQLQQQSSPKENKKIINQNSIDTRDSSALSSNKTTTLNLMSRISTIETSADSTNSANLTYSALNVCSELINEIVVR